MVSEHGVHRRFDPLSGEWVLVSPHRGARPWQGQLDAPAPIRTSFEDDCHLCPGNTRAGGQHNPDYAGVFVFDNDFPALLDISEGEATSAGLLRSAPVAGACRVICFSPRHDLSLGELEASARRRVVDTWAGQIRELGKRWAWVQCFENRGAMMGCSSPHPHGQVWAMDEVPTLVAREAERQRAHRDDQGSVLLLDVLDAELATRERVVAENAHWVVLVPFWARWPFETLLLPRRHIACLTELESTEADALAEIIGELMCAYDNLFACDFPYSFGWHGVPSDAGADLRAAWQLHAHCYPPLLRSASVRKFMVGFEMLAEAQRDLTPEDAAARLRAARGPHWRRASSP